MNLINLWGTTRKDAHDALNRMQLTMDACRTMRTPFMATILDAAGCFDQSRPNAIVLSHRKMGMPAQMTVSQATTQTRMAHHIKTTHGVSKNAIERTASNNIARWSQGNGEGVAACNDQTEVQMKVFEGNTAGFTLQSPNGSDNLKKYGPHFIDDVNLLHAFPHDVTPAEVFGTGGNTLQIWQHLLAIGGGGLALP